MISCTKMKMFLGKNEMQKEDCHRVTLEEVFSWPPSCCSNDQMIKEMRRWSRRTNPGDKDKETEGNTPFDVEPPSNTVSNSLTEVELDLEKECAQTDIVFIRPLTLVVLFSGLFISSCTLDMSAAGFNTWPQFIWMPILSVLFPFIVHYFILHKFKKDDLLSALDNRDKNFGKLSILHHVLISLCSINLPSTFSSTGDQIELNHVKTAQSNPMHQDEVEISQS